MRSGLRKWGIRFYLACLFLLLPLYGVVMITNSSAFCGQCHIMRPEVVTWQASAHNKIDCVSCHVQPGFKNAVLHEGEVLRRVYLTLSGQYSLPVEIKQRVLNESCLKCHTLSRNVTPLNDIVIPHAQHVEEGVTCMECHQGLGHGRIAQNGLTNDGEFDKWTRELGSSQIIPANLRIGMKECMDCHLKRKEGPVQCIDCHKKKEPPQSHATKQVWLNNHGKEAILDVTLCEGCHNYLNIDRKKLTEEDTNMTRYARNNSFCNDCHVASGSFHNDSWAIDHTKMVTLDSAKGCLVCHNLVQPQPDEKRPKTYCNMCHEDNLGSTYFHIK
ncbi:MAG: cytochrome c3 family protein [Desulfitobacteriaceae bacterium]